MGTTWSLALQDAKRGTSYWTVISAHLGTLGFIRHVHLTKVHAIKVPVLIRCPFTSSQTRGDVVP
jgi:hypothetical protein